MLINNHITTIRLKLIVFQIFQLEVKKNDVIGNVVSRVKFSKCVFHAYRSKGNLTLISNHMPIIHSISIFFQIITFEVDDIVDSYKVVLNPLVN